MTRYPFLKLSGQVLSAGLLLLLSMNGLAVAQPADAAWPMFHFDAKHTGRSGHSGPLFPSGTPSAADVKVISLGDRIKTQPIIGEDGTIYVGVGFVICAVDPPSSANGFKLTRKSTWGTGTSTPGCTRLRADAGQSSPAVDLNGFIYMGDRGNDLSAFDPVDGHVVCRWTHGTEGDIMNAPTIGPDGTVYFAPGNSNYGQGPVIATNPAPFCSFQNQKWFYPTGNFINQSSPAVVVEGADTFVYIGDMLGFVYKLRADNGQFVWRYRIGNKINASPVVRQDGATTTIYIASDLGLTAVNPDGSVKWTRATLGYADQTPALAVDGTIYVGSKSGKSKTFYAVRPDGTLKWQYGPLFSEADLAPMPIVGFDGVIYVLIGINVHALSPAKDVLWTYALNHYPLNHASIGVGPGSTPGTYQGILYVGTAGFNLYAISSERASCISNPTPIAKAGVDQTVDVGQSVNFNGGGSSDPNSNPLTYAWDFGDGSSAIGQNPSHTYWASDDKVVTLTVSDTCSSSADTMTVTVNSNPPHGVNDSFNRGAGCTVSSPCALGSPWVVSPTNGFVIFGDQMRNAATTGNHIALRPDLVGADQMVEADFASVSNSPSPHFDIFLRYQNTGNFYRFSRWVGGTSILRITKVVDGVETVLKQASVPNPLQNALFHMKAEVTGSTLTFTVPGVSTITAQDSSIPGGQVGVLVSTGWAVQHIVDNFHGEIR